jgi:hypothetical protein
MTEKTTHPAVAVTQGGPAKAEQERQAETKVHHEKMPKPGCGD